MLLQSVRAGFALSLAPVVSAPRPPSGACLDRVPDPSGPETVGLSAERIRTVRSAWQAAARAEGPLLVIVCPVDRSERHRRGQMWGEAITHGPADLLKRLMTATPVVATQAELALFLPDYTVQHPEPVAVRVDPCGIPAGWTAHSAELPYSGVYEDDNFKERVAAISAVVADLLPEPAEGVRARLAVSGRRAAPIPGAHWARHTACGIDYEDPDTAPAPVGILCGMSHVPERSKRFLRFWS